MGARDVLPPDAVARPFCRLAIVTVVSARGAVGSSPVARSARGDDRAAAVGQWRRWPRLLLGEETWWRGRLRAFAHVGKI